MSHTNLNVKTMIFPHLKGLSVIALSMVITACASYKAPVQDVSTSGVDGTFESSDQQFQTQPQSQVPEGLQGQPLQTDDISGQELQGQPLLSDESVEAQALPSTRSSPPVVAQLLRQSEEASAQQDWQKAESYLQRALRISPKNALLWSRMAEAKLKQGKNAQAIQFASKSNAISTDVNLKLANDAIIEAAR